MTATASEELLSCSFCTKKQTEIAKLIAGPGVYICNECVGLCNDILSEELGIDDIHDRLNRPTADPSGPPTSLKRWDDISDEELLAEMVQTHSSHQNVDRAVAEHVAALRARGVSWSRIGEALGMARQSAWERFSGED